MPPSVNALGLVKSAFRSFFSGNQTETPEGGLDMGDVSSGKFTSFGTEYSRLMRSGKSALSRLHGTMESTGGVDYLKRFYNLDTGTDSRYRGFAVTLPGKDDDAFSYALRGEREAIIGNLTQDNPWRDAERMDSVARHSRSLAAIEKSASFGALDRDYINRPGIAPILSMIEKAQSEITIDIFQLQNQSVVDALMKRATEGVSLNIRTAMPDAGSTDRKSFDILGPNIITLESMRKLNEKIESETGKPGPIKLFYADRKSHPKVLVTDKEAYVGSLNLTSPVGGSPLQGGANYEAIRRVEVGIYGERFENGEQVNGALNELLKRRGGAGTKESRSALLYHQLRNVVSAEAFESERKRADGSFDYRNSYGQGQVVGTRETYQELKGALSMVREGKNRVFTGILNQPWLLMLDEGLHTDMMSGEMGKWSAETVSPGDIKSRGKTYRGLQRDLFDRILENQAYLAVDNRGYGEKVITPFYERVERLLGERFQKEYGGSLEKLADAVGGLRTLSAKGQIEGVRKSMSEMGVRVDEDFARQLLAITSGNIRQSTVAMQHVKSFMVTEGQKVGKKWDLTGGSARALSYYLGSSNFGAYSLSFAGEFDNKANREIGLAFSLGKARSKKGTYSLTEEEERAELEGGLENFQKQFFFLTGSHMSALESGASIKAWYEDKVHHAGLMELKGRLDALGEKSGGIRSHFIYGGRSGTEAIGLEMVVDVKELAGFGKGINSTFGEGPRFNMRFTVLGSGMGGEPGYVLSLDSGKVISRSLLLNNSGSKLHEISPYGKGDGSPYGRDMGDRYQIMSPIDTTTSLVSTLALEGLHRATVWGPQQYMMGLDREQKVSLALDYLDYLSSGRRGSELGDHGSGTYFLRSSALHMQQMKDSMLERFGTPTGALEKARAFHEKKLSYEEESEANRERLSLVDGLITQMMVPQGEGGINAEAETLRKINILMGEGGLASTLVDLMDKSPEVLLDVVQNLRGTEYDRALTRSMREFKDSLFEPFLYEGEVAKYVGSQGMARLPIYQISDRMAEGLRGRIEDRSPVDFLRSFALMAPAQYGPSSDLAVDDIWRSIASKSTINPGSSEFRGATAFGLLGSQVGDAFDPYLGLEMGIGFRTHLDDMRAYRDEYAPPGEREKVDRLIKQRFGSGDRSLTYTFGAIGKLTSVPQRLKNISGQMALMPMTYMAQTILDAERGRGVSPIEGNPDKVNDLERAAYDLMKESLGMPSLHGYAAAYKEILRQRVSAVYGERIADTLVTDDAAYSAIYGGDIRKVLGSTQKRELTLYMQHLNDLAGRQLSYERDDRDRDETGVGYYLLRARAVSADLLPGGVKGFTGGRVRDPLVLVQLSGAFTDTFKANPLYGGGQREGFIEVSNTKIRTSRLGTRVEMLGEAGDMVGFDAERNQVLVFRDGKLIRTVDDSGQLSILSGVIDGLQRGTGGKSLSTEGLSSFAATRGGEDAIDYILGVKRLQGSHGAGMEEYQITRASSILPKGGRRVTGGFSGGLFKGVADFASEAAFREYLETKREERRSSGRTSAIDKALLGDEDGAMERVFGLANTSNLKSFFFSHGANIIADKEKTGALLSGVGGSKGVAMSLLLQFGSQWVDGGQYTPETATLGRELLSSLAEGELGGFYRTLASSLTLQHGEEVAAAILMGYDKARVRDGIFMAGNANADRYNITQLPQLVQMTATDMLAAMRGEGDLLGRVRNILEGTDQSNTEARERAYGNHGAGNETLLRGSMDLGDMRERGRAMMATALDITVQMSEQSALTGGGPDKLMLVGDLDIAPTREGNRNLIKIASSMGFDTYRVAAGLRDGATRSDRDYAEEARSITLGMAGRVATVGLYMDLAFSRSQEPSGKKTTGNLEGIAMLKPFFSLSDKFAKEGNLSALRMSVAQVIAGTSVAEMGSSIVGSLQGKWDRMNLLDPLRYTPMEAKDYIGIYGSGIEKMDTIRRDYESYASAMESAIQVRVGKLAAIERQLTDPGQSQNKDRLLLRKGALLEQVSGLLSKGMDPTASIRVGGREIRVESLLRGSGGFSSLQERLDSVAERYDLFADKPDAVGLGAAISENLTHRGGIIELPALILEGVVDGRAVYRIDRNNKRSAYLFSGEQLRALSSAYGGHLEDVTKSTIRIAGALAPNTLLNKAMRTIANAAGGGLLRVSLTLEESEVIEGLQEDIRALPGQVAKLAAGEQFKRVMGGTATLPGATTTPGASFLVPEGTTFLSEWSLGKAGARASQYRLDELKSTTQRLLEIETELSLEGRKDKDLLVRERALFLERRDILISGGKRTDAFAMERVERDASILQELGARDPDAALQEATRLWESYRSEIEEGGSRYALLFGETLMERERLRLGYTDPVEVMETLELRKPESFGTSEQYERVQSLSATAAMSLESLIENRPERLSDVGKLDLSLRPRYDSDSMSLLGGVGGGHQLISAMGIAKDIYSLMRPHDEREAQYLLQRHMGGEVEPTYTYSSEWTREVAKTYEALLHGLRQEEYTSSRGWEAHLTSRLKEGRERIGQRLEEELGRWDTLPADMDADTLKALRGRDLVLPLLSEWKDDLYSASRARREAERAGKKYEQLAARAKRIEAKLMKDGELLRAKYEYSFAGGEILEPLRLEEERARGKVDSLIKRLGEMEGALDVHLAGSATFNLLSGGTLFARLPRGERAGAFTLDWIEGEKTAIESVMKKEGIPNWKRTKLGAALQRLDNMPQPSSWEEYAQLRYEFETSFLKGGIADRDFLGQELDRMNTLYGEEGTYKKSYDLLGDMREGTSLRRDWLDILPEEGGIREGVLHVEEEFKTSLQSLAERARSVERSGLFSNFMRLFAMDGGKTKRVYDMMNILPEGGDRDIAKGFLTAWEKRTNDILALEESMGRTLREGRLSMRYLAQNIEGGDEARAKYLSDYESSEIRRIEEESRTIGMMGNTRSMKEKYTSLLQTGEKTVDTLLEELEIAIFDLKDKQRSLEFAGVIHNKQREELLALVSSGEERMLRLEAALSSAQQRASDAEIEYEYRKASLEGIEQKLEGAAKLWKEGYEKHKEALSYYLEIARGSKMLHTIEGAAFRSILQEGGGAGERFAGYMDILSSFGAAIEERSIEHLDRIPGLIVDAGGTEKDKVNRNIAFALFALSGGETESGMNEYRERASRNMTYDLGSGGEKLLMGMSDKVRGLLELIESNPAHDTAKIELTKLHSEFVGAMSAYERERAAYEGTPDVFDRELLLSLGGERMTVREGVWNEREREIQEERRLRRLESMEGMSERFRPLNIEAVSGRLRGGLEIYQINEQLLRGVDGESALSFMEGKIGSLRTSYETILKRLEVVEKEQFGIESRMDMVRRGREGAYKLLPELDKIRDEMLRAGSDPGSAARIAAHRVNLLMVEQDQTPLLQAITFRNAPFGSTETHQQALSVLSGMHLLNEYAEKANEFFRPDSRKRIHAGTRDLERNQTLTLLNPISMLTTNLGDFDGDTYTAIFSSLADMHRGIEDRQDTIHLAMRKSAYEASRYKSLLSKERAGEGLSLDEMEDMERIRSIQKQSGQTIREQRGLIREAAGNIRAAQWELEKGYGNAVRKEVANYLGLHEGFFLSQTDGGFLPGDSLDIAAIPTFLEQGKGLLPAMSDKATGGGLERGARLLHMTSIALAGEAERTGVSIRHLDVDMMARLPNWRETEVGKYILSSLPHDDKKLRGLAENLLDSEKVRVDYLAQARDSLLHAVGAERAESLLRRVDFESGGQYEERLLRSTQERVGTLSGMMTAHLEGLGFLTKGMGASLQGEGTYSMLTKVLGKSGGDILGKAYNTMVGTLFERSPIIALGSTLLSEADRGGGVTARAMTEKRLTEYYESLGEPEAKERARSFLSSLEEETRGADELMKFMKSNQQLLRDSIKFKGDMTKVVSSLQSLQGEYDALDESALLEPHEREKQKRRIINSMAGKLGWGPGLQAFSELDTLIGKAGDSSLSGRLSAERGDSLRDTLRHEFNLEDGELSRLAGEMNMVRGEKGLPEIADPTVRQVLEYKVSRGLQDMNAAYRYQLTEKVGKEGMSGLMGVMKRGMGNFLTSLGLEGEDDVSRIQAAFDERTVLGKIRQSRASSILGDEWQMVKDKALMKGASLDDTTPLMRLLPLLESTERETSDIFGVAGEKLGGLTQLSAYGKMSRTIGRGDSDVPLAGPDADLLVKGDILGSMLNVAAAGKLNPEAMSNYAALIAQAAKDAGIRGEEGGGDISKILPRRTDRQSYLADTLAGLSQWESAGERAPVKVGEQSYASLSEFVKRDTASTTAGQRVDAVSNLIRSFQGEERGTSMESYFSSMLSDDSKHLAKGLSESLEIAMREQARPTALLEPRQLQAWETVGNQKAMAAAQERVHKAAAALQDRLEVGAGLGIALAASLLMSGGLTEAAYKQALGGAVLAFGYARSSTTGTGGAFRVRMAQEGGGRGEEGRWLQEWMVREAAFAAGSAALHPYATRVAGAAMEGISRLMGSPMARPMDIERYTPRGGVQAVSGAILSAIMGGTATWGAEATLTGVEDISQSLGAVGRMLQETLESNMRRNNEMALLMDEGPDVEAEDDPYMEAAAISYEISEGISIEDLDWVQNLSGEEAVGDVDGSVDAEWVYDVA